MVNNVSQQLGCIHQTWTCLCSIINYSSCPLPHCILNIYLISYLFQKVGCRGYDPSAKRTQSPNSPSQSKQYATSKSVKLNNFLIIVKKPYSSFDTWQRICRINSVNSRCDVSKNPDQSFKASFYLNNVWVCDGTGKYEKITKDLGAKKTLVYFAKNLNIFVVDTTKVPEENMYSIDANYPVEIAKCELKSIFRFHLNLFIDNHKMVKLELRNINACSYPLVENHFNEIASCFKLIKEGTKKELKTHMESWFYKENSVTHKMDDFLLQYVAK